MIAVTQYPLVVCHCQLMQGMDLLHEIMHLVNVVDMLQCDTEVSSPAEVAILPTNIISGVHADFRMAMIGC